jgi:hypothetical protein
LKGSGFRGSGLKIDGPVKSPEKADFQISQLIVSIGYEIKK